ncbi:hypothetical protein [Paenibacillus algorifonticola]|uniref:hypothetical protein n=1 Tax=Paenibacillus algorifonticola TaxID=684063 RepID=UPI0006199929|nr:hypothetical protein [Paenibacillus algorifonticola]
MNATKQTALRLIESPKPAVFLLKAPSGTKKSAIFAAQASFFKICLHVPDCIERLSSLPHT